jgi:CHAT domain-containing protein
LLVLSNCRQPAADPSAAFSTVRRATYQGNFELARSEAQRQYRRWQSRPDQLWFWKWKLMNAEMLLLNGQTREAQTLLSSSLSNRFALLQPRYNMLQGYIAFRNGKEADAKGIVSEAAMAAHAQQDFETEADCNLLLAAYASPEDAGATDLIDRTLNLTQAHGLTYQSAAALLNLGLLRIYQSKYTMAIAALKEGADLASRAGATLLYSMNMGNLATCYYNLGDFERSMEIRNQVIPVQKRAGLLTPLRDSYLELGSTQLLEGNTKEAIQSMRNALSLADKRDMPGDYAIIAQNLAGALETAGQLGEAELLNRQAEAVVPPSAPEVRLELRRNRADIEEHRGNHDGALKLYRELAATSAKFPRVAWSAQAAAAQILATRPDAGSRLEARDRFEAALQTIESNRTQQGDRAYQITFLSKLIRLYQSYVAFLVRQGDVRKALLVADSSRAAVLTDSITGINPRDNPGLIVKMQSAAGRSRAGILFYFLAPRGSYLWVITDKDLKCIALPGEDEIAASVRSYRQMLELDKADPLQSASTLPRRLFDTLIAPVLPVLGERRNIILVADGSLHHLNFETLVSGSPALHYWLQDVTISVAPSLSLLGATQRTRSKSPASLLLIGDSVPPAAEYPELPYARQEMSQVQSHFPTVTTTVLQRGSAMPSGFEKANPERFAFLHIAAHAEVNERSPLDSAIILSAEKNGYRLYAREIMSTRLNAELVVLSACRSASSRTLSGEGPVGFVWAFFQSGAQNVAASLWDANDRSTATLMDRFYTALDRGETFAQALRSAKLQALRDTPKPYHWAPFELYVRNFPN